MAKPKKVTKKFSNKAFLMDSNDLHNTLRLTVKAEKSISLIFKEINAELIKAVKKFINKGIREDLELLEESIEINALSAAEIAIINAEFDREIAAVEVGLSNRVKQTIRDVISESFRRGAQVAQQHVNIVTQKPAPTRFTLTAKDRRIIQTLKETDFSLIKTLTTRHIAEARAIVVQGLHDGLGQKAIILEMMQRLRSSEINARRIVRTEITRTANLGARRRYLDAGLTIWQWNTALDERVCPTCAPLHGVSIKIGDPFNPFMTAQGRRNISHLLPHNVTQPPAHPFCRCGVTLSFTKTSLKRKPAIKKVQVKIKGFTKKQKESLMEFLKVIPNDVKKQVKVLNGILPIVKTKGRVVDDPEFQKLVSPALLNKYRKSEGFYLGGNLNKVFVAKGTGNIQALHEVGHAIYDEYVKLRGKKRQKWLNIHNQHLVTGDFITPRSSQRVEEHFADSLRFYLLKPLTLKLKYPEIYDFMQKNIFFGNETGSIVTLEDGFIYKRFDGVWKKHE